MDKNRRTTAFTILTAFCLIGMLFITGCNSYDDALTQEFTSPEKTHMVVVKYDFAGRPDVFLKNGKQIFKYSKQGFMETVRFDVEWLSEDEFILYLDPEQYADEKYTVKIPA